ncbi:hypothetical protein BX600DRAFT_516118 [Xylariales sp. PMI_506]|nr:hypothetical protein BX600DRAFT_516118 [Xylariales sp. PMI_506]
MGRIDEALSLEARNRITQELKAANDQFLHDIPKVELHVHIEGTLTPELRWTLAQRNGITLKLERTGAIYKSLEQLRSSYDILEPREEHSFDNDEERFTFFEAYYGGFEVLVKQEDYYDLAMNYFEHAATMNVRYCELFFDPQGHTRRGVSWDTMMSGFRRAQLDAEKKLGIKSNWIMCILRDLSLESAVKHYQAALTYRDMIVAIGLDSDEEDHPPSLFEDVFKVARQDGFYLTAHCDVGMSKAHENIRQVATTVGGTGADRIDHGLNAATSDDLVKLIKEKDIGMTLTPYGYVRHEPADDVFSRIITLYEAGIRITISSDDPAYMQDCWILQSYQWTKKFCNFTNRDMAKIATNAVDICWAPPQVKEGILAEIESVLARHAT